MESKQNMMTDNELELYVALNALMLLIDLYNDAIDNVRDPQNLSPEESDRVFSIVNDIIVLLGADSIHWFLSNEHYRLWQTLNETKGTLQ